MTTPPESERESTMPDYRHELLFGVFITPHNQPPMHAVHLAVAAEHAGLDLATFQDHPYQPMFHDTWTLMSFIAARTERIRLASNVLNLPLRQPAVMARSAASLDLLSDGRFDMGIGAGGFWDAIESMGGRRLSPGESVEALEEAIEIIRGIWDTDAIGRLQVDGTHYRVDGAKRGPTPAHDIGVWVGAYKPRILRLTGRVADGWLPSLGYLPNGSADLGEMNRYIDEGAEGAGREPRAVRRLLNIGGQFVSAGAGVLVGPPQQWAEELAEIALDYGISGFILAADESQPIERFAAEVVPAVRQLVGAERASRGSAAS